MPILYIAFAPILLIALYKRIGSLMSAFKGGNYSKVKVELLFVSLIIVVAAFVVFHIESIGS